MTEVVEMYLDPGVKIDAGISKKDDSLRDGARHSLMSQVEEDNILVKRVLGGDREAYRTLVEKYQNRAFGIAFEILNSREDAEDVVQESFVKAYLSLSQFKGQASFYTWFYRIVYNMSIDFKRKISRRSNNSVEFEENITDQVTSPITSSVQSGEDILSRKQQAKRIQDVLSGISEEHRTVLMLREIEGLNYEQIAKVTGITRGTVMSRLHYARKKLQKALADLMGHSTEPVTGAENDNSRKDLKKDSQPTGQSVGLSLKRMGE